MSAPRGVYCMANDGVHDWFVAFCESLRARVGAADLPLVVIPFDDRMDEIEPLRERYGFEILDDRALPRLDAIGERIWPGRPGDWHSFRKLASFWGPLEDFVFLDADVVVLEDPRLFLDAYRDRSDGTQLMFFDWDMDMVYLPGELRDRMTAAGARGFNSGGFASSRGRLSIERLEQLAAEAEPVRDQFPPEVGGEQPFFNFCVDSLGWRTRSFQEELDDLAVCWAGLDIEWDGHRGRVADRTRPDFGKRLPFLHWAGSPLTPWMPHKRVFLDYRLARDSGTLARTRYEARLASLAMQRVPGAVRKRLGHA
jgi:hypothetical protein